MILQTAAGRMNTAKNTIPAIAFAVISLVMCADVARAQGSRKDDIVFNAQGRPMAGATVRICSPGATGQPCSPLAQIYSDTLLSQALANPTSADGLGNYSFYAAPGRYMIEISGPGITTKQIPNVILPSDPSSPTFTTVTTTSGISAFSLSLAGDLTVSGSAAVTGTFTVGGAPVPSTNADNQWTGGQRFKGPVPYRDFSAYMPPGGCSSTDFNDPNTTGSITNGSATLTLSNARDFKNGCGITVLHAGVTSSLIMPSSCTAAVSRTGNVVTVTCSANHRLAVGFDGFGVDESVVISGCSDASFNGVTAGIQTVPSTTTLTYNQTASNSTATGCTVSFLNGWAHGATGSTTYYYKFTACGPDGGCSAAVGPVTIANGNASLTADNFNWVGYPIVLGAKLACIYRSTDNVTYTAIGTSLTQGYTDRGLPFPVFPGCPSTPVGSPTAGQLTTTIAAGGGTTTLTLAATASNTAITQSVYHDETSFLRTCVNDVASDQTKTWTVGSHGCLIPAGNWNFNSDAVTDSDTAANSGGIAIHVDGTMVLNTWPWIFTSGNWYLQGQGFSGGQVGGTHFPSAYLRTGANVAAAFAMQGNNVIIHGFSLMSLRGHGIYMGPQLGGNFATAGLDLENINFNESAGNTGGVPLVFDSNSLYVYAKNINIVPNTTGIPASIHFTTNSYGGNTWCCMTFQDIFTDYHHLLFDSPAGNNGGRGAGIIFRHWESELHGAYPTGGVVTIDTGNVNGTPGASPGINIPGIDLANFDNADASNKILTYIKGQNQLSPPDIALTSSDQFTTLICAPGAAACSGAKVNITSNSPQILTGNSGYQGPAGFAYLLQRPFITSMGYGDWAQTPAHPSWADAMPAPYTLAVNSTGAGSLAAAQYCIKIVGLDAQTPPGQTLPSSEVCQTVGASSSISLTWQLPTISTTGGQMFSGYQLWYGSTPGGENKWIDTAIGPSAATTINYTFTSTAGNTSGTIPSVPTAYLSWLNRDPAKPSCLFCTAASSGRWQLGIGEPNVPAGDKLAVKGGVLNAESGFKSGLVTKSGNYTLTTADYWVNVTGTTTITVPHVSVGNHWVVFNSGTNTVTVQADSGNINGGANITLSANTGREVTCDGTNCFAH